MRRLIVLRPEPGASATAARAAALGLDVLVHPIFAAVAVPWTLPEGPFDAMLLTSANAVRLGGALPDLPVHAVGAATAEAARSAGLTVASIGTGGVEALLGGLAGGLRLLHPGAEERIAPDAPAQTITAVTVYRAEPLPLPSPDVADGTVLLVHSPAAGRRLGAFCADWRPGVRIAAISDAAVHACGLGWAGCEAATAPTDAALLSLAAKLCEEQAP